MMLCRSSSVLLVSSWSTCLRLSKVNVIDRELLRGMPSIRTIPNQCVEYRVLFDYTSIICLIIKSRYVVYVALFEDIHIISCLVTCKISMMSTMDAMECLLSIRFCANFDFTFL